MNNTTDTKGIRHPKFRFGLIQYTSRESKRYVKSEKRKAGKLLTTGCFKDGITLAKAYRLRGEDEEVVHTAQRVGE